MKKLTRMMVFALVLTSALFASCKKDKNDSKPENPLQKSYFSIEKSTFVDGEFPAPSAQNAPVIINVYGNTSVLEGGSNPISINTSASVKEILVGIEGKKGYYKVAPGSLKSASQSYLIYLLFSQNFAEESFAILIAIRDNAGLISARQVINVSRVVAGTGKLQVSCSWDKPNDLDLHLVEPNGFDIGWDTDESENGGILDVDSNPICIMDHINNENITYSGTAKVENGKYKVKISLFSSCNVTEVTNFVVTARLNGNLVTPTLGKNPFYGKVEASKAYIDGNGPRGGEVVMEFNVSGMKSALQEQPMLQFSYPRQVNEAKKAMDSSK